MATGVGSRVIQLAGTLVLTRFIAPADYGAVSAASICAASAALVTTFNPGQYLIARKPPAAVAFQAAVANLLFCLAGMIVVVGLGSRLEALVEAPGMNRFLPIFAAAQLLDRARNVPENLLARDLRFRTVAIIRGLGELTFTATALALAVGPRWGGAAIAAATLARSALTAGLFVTIGPRAEWLVLARFDKASLGALLRYGAPITAASVAHHAATRWDNLLVSHFFGPAIMAAYNLAYSLAETPVSYVAEHVNDVLMPTFSKLEPHQRPAALARSAALMSLLIAPLGVGLGAIATTLVAIAFDARWAAMGTMLTLLSVMTIFRPMSWPAIAFLSAQQRTKPIMYASLFRAALLVASIATVGRAGPAFTCVCVGATFASHSLVTILVVRFTDGVSIRPYLFGVARPLAACAPMFFVVTALREALGPGDVRHGVVSLVLQIAAGALTYIVAAFLLARPIVDDLRDLARGAFRRS